MTSYSQEKRLIDRVYFGGNFGVAFQPGVYTYLNLSPFAGYKFTPRFSSGIGLVFNYIKELETHTSIYGGNIFSRYMIIENLGDHLRFLSSLSILGHVEYELLNAEKKIQSLDETGRFYIHNVLVGGGLQQQMGKRTAIEMLVLWNINQSVTNNISSSNPIFRFGIIF